MPDTTSRSYVGVDPALRHTGLAIIKVDETSVQLQTHVLQSQQRGILRLQDLRDQLRMILHSVYLKYTITGACIEGPALEAINRADDLGQIRGVYAVAVADFSCPIYVVPPTQLKRYTTGHGSCGKQNMQLAAEKEWDKQLTDDEADAAWLAHMAHALFGKPTPTLRKRHQVEVIHGIRNPKGKDRSAPQRQTDF